jgi:DNA polymerase
MPVLFHDFETRSTLDLGDVGAWKYACDTTTEVWCCAYAVDDGPIQLWLPGDPVPPEFIEAANSPDWLTSAFGDHFERLITQHLMMPRYGWPLIPIERRRCLQAAALALALPAKLKNVAAVLKLKQQKDESGHHVMMQMAKPRKRRKDEDPSGIYWFDDAERREQLHAYCRQDVATERALHHKIEGLSSEEQALWTLDSTINDRGLYIDGQLLDAAITIAEAAEDAISTELQMITEGALETIHQTAKLIAWLAEQDCTVTDVQKTTVKRALTRKNIAPAARRVLELRLDGAHAATAKLTTMRAWRNGDGRARGTFRYHGASTGRWTSFGIQLQNLKRPLVEDTAAAIEAVSTGSLELMRQRYPQPMSVVGDIARALICAAPGHRLIAADLSGIESRVTAWISGQQDKLDQWAKFDHTKDPNDEPYYILGRRFGIAQEQARTIGKTADLAFGYMGGAGAWEKLAPDDDTSTEDEIKQRQKAWRSAHQNTVKFWGRINRAAIQAVGKPGAVFECGRIAFECDGMFLRMKLPSGRKLAYPFPKLLMDKFENLAVVFMDNAGGKWTECRCGLGAYGGTWIENVVQAVSRDLFAAAMVRLEAADYPIVLHVHDEIVAEVPNNFGSTEEFLRILTTAPAWAEGLPIAAKARNGPRFCKITEPKNTTLPWSAPTVVELVGVKPWDIDPINYPPPPPPPPPAQQPNWQEALEQKFAHAEAAFAAAAATADPPPHTKDEAQQQKTRSGGEESYPRGEQRGGRRVATYLYRDYLGGNHTEVKKMRASKAKRPQYPQRFWVNGRWVDEKPAGWSKVPYRLPELLAAITKNPDVKVFNPEGEKDCETLVALGLVATTNSEGATPLKAKVGKWTPELNRWFHGVRQLFIPADNDEVGRKFAEEKARALESIVPDIRIVLFPDTPIGEDVTWWINHGHTKEELLARCEATPHWQGGGILESVRASDVTMRAIVWLWDKRFAIGKIGIIAGLPDEGKGQILCYIAARATQSLEWPNGEGRAPQGNVIILSAEEDPSDSLTPRLAAAGADLGRIHFAKMIVDRDEKTGQQHKRMFSFVGDLEKLRQKIVEVGDVIAVLIDPISAYLGIGKVDSYRDTDVRAVLGPLKELAEDMRIAIITIMHFNKKVDITNALLRVSNSLAFVGLPRHAYGVIADAENHRKLFVRAKNNDAAEADNKTLAFHFDVKEVGKDPDTKKEIRAPFVVWEPGYIDVTATEAMQAASESKSPGERDRAKDLLRDFLLAYPDHRALQKEIEDYAKAEKISDRTLRRAKTELKIRAEKAKDMPSGPWYWALPEDE